jgi:quercetin dioxygenase-like cupin family protein
MKRIWSVLFLLGIVTMAAAGVGAQAMHVVQNTTDAKWGPAPPMVPAGAEIAVVSGDPSKTGPFVIRLKFPANYTIPAHSHPTDENVTVLSGSVFVGMGDKADRTAGDAVGTGGFVLLPQGMNHYAYTKAAATILLFGQGPFDFKYVDPKDDPRHK